MATNEQRRLFGMGAIAVQALLFLFFLLFTTYSNDLGSGLEDCGTLVDSSLCSNTTGCTYDVSNGVCVGSDGTWSIPSAALPLTSFLSTFYYESVLSRPVFTRWAAPVSVLVLARIAR